MMCFDEATGNFLWQLSVPKLKEGRVNDWPGIGICSSPTVDGDRVYVVTNRGELLCPVGGRIEKRETADHSRMKACTSKIPTSSPASRSTSFASMPVDDSEADIIWRMDMRDPEVLGAFPHNASNCSVLIDGDRLYCTSSNGVDWGHSYVPSALAPSYFLREQDDRRRTVGRRIESRQQRARRLRTRAPDLPRHLVESIAGQHQRQEGRFTTAVPERVSLCARRRDRQNGLVGRLRVAQAEEIRIGSVHRVRSVIAEGPERNRFHAGCS